MSNPLVAAPVDTATPFSGAGLLDSGTQLASAIESGSWVEGGIAAFSVALDTAATVMDPLGSLIGAGLGWLIDHFEPLKGWFNDLTGDAGEVAAFSHTWANIQQQLQGAGDELVRVLSDVDDLHGEAMDAYRRFQGDAAAHLSGAASWAGAMSTGLSVASTIVQVVHDLVRDVISQLVGSAISWAAEAVFSLGLATPWIVSQVTSRVSSLAAKVGTKVTALIRAVKSLAKLMDELKALLRKADEIFSSLLRRGTPTSPRAPHADDLPAVRRPDAADIAQDTQALSDYTGPHYVEINEALRGQRPMTPALQDEIAAATRALDRLPDHAGPVLRGENAPANASYLDAYQPGRTVTNDSFTSADIDRAFPGNVQYAIDSLHGKSVRHVSQYATTENEVLFRPGTQFTVLSRVYDSGVLNITMREVG